MSIKRHMTALYYSCLQYCFIFTSSYEQRCPLCKFKNGHVLFFTDRDSRCHLAMIIFYVIDTTIHLLTVLGGV